MDDAIVAFKWPPWIDSESELEALGDQFAENVFFFCQDLVAGTVDHWSLNPFETFRQVPIYKYQYDERYCLLAVEDDGSGERRVTIMLAGLTGSQVVVDGQAWDGIDMGILRSHFLDRRLRTYFP
ncbi:MAG TPA: hypothetical protein VMS43_08135 [Allosphingosinicella sp.]|nr:hypothetical protein [Allosphingosinicella sp.]